MSPDELHLPLAQMRDAHGSPLVHAAPEGRPATQVCEVVSQMDVG
jgi:hypothetical protein